MFSTVEELLKLADIMGTSYTQLNAVNTTHAIPHRTGKFGLAICERNQEVRLFCEVTRV